MKRRLVVGVVAVLLMQCLTAAQAAPHRFSVGRSRSSVDGCGVHLVRHGESRERTLPCDQMIELDSAKYDVWLQSSAGITPYRTTIDGSLKGEHVLSLLAAGTVRVSVPSEHTVELWHLEPHTIDGALQRAFWREAALSGSLLMPEGPAIALARAKDGAIDQVSSVVQVIGSRLVSVAWAPASETALVADLTIPNGVHPDPKARLLLRMSEREIVPVIELSVEDRIRGLWLSVPTGSAEVHLASSSLFVARSQFRVRRGANVFTGQLRRLPQLDVSVRSMNPSIRLPDVSVDVKRSDGAVVRIVERVDNIAHLADLPAEVLTLTAHVAEWTFRRDVDLSGGKDAVEEFLLKPFLVTGTVRYGGESVPATVSFGADKLLSVDSNERGEYRVVLWKARRYGIRVVLREHVDIPPFVDTAILDGDQEFDIDIPTANYTLKIVDAEAGTGIELPRVNVANSWNDPSQGDRRTLVNIVGDRYGVTLLPPLRAGTLVMRIEANGYEPMELSRSVDPTAAPTEIVAKLKRLTDATILQMEDASGGPAAGTEVFAIRTGRIVFAGTTARDGTIAIPRDLDRVLLVARHATLAGAIRWWTAQTTVSEPILWRLEQAGRTLTIQARDAAGKPRAGSLVYVWLDGNRIGGTPLALLCGCGAAVTSVNGIWYWRNPPAHDLRIIVAATDAVAIEAGGYDNLAIHAAYPWPATLDVRSW